MPDQPVSVPLWPATGNATEPPAGLKTAGWVGGQQPPAQFLNWLAKFTGLNLQYLIDLANEFAWESFEVAAQTVPDDTVAIKAGKSLGANGLIEIAADPAFGGFAARGAFDRIDLVYVTGAGGFGIVTGDVTATVVPNYAGRTVIAEITVTAGAGAAVIATANINMIRTAFAQRAAIFADFAGTFARLGAAIPKVTMYADADELRIGINCDANYFAAGPKIAAGYGAGIFDPTAAVLLIRFAINGSVSTGTAVIDVYQGNKTWTDNADITLVEIAVWGKVDGVYRWEIYDGASLNYILDSTVVSAASGHYHSGVDGQGPKIPSGSLAPITLTISDPFGAPVVDGVYSGTFQVGNPGDRLMQMRMEVLEPAGVPTLVFANVNLYRVDRQQALIDPLVVNYYWSVTVSGATGAEAADLKFFAVAQ